MLSTGSIKASVRNRISLGCGIVEGIFQLTRTPIFTLELIVSRTGQISLPDRISNHTSRRINCANGSATRIADERLFPKMVYYYL